MFSQNKSYIKIGILKFLLLKIFIIKDRFIHYFKIKFLLVFKFYTCDKTSQPT